MPMPMNDEQFSHLLKKHRPEAPIAPANEWARIERRTRTLGSLLSSILRPSYALGAGLAMAGLALVIVPRLQTSQNAADQASLEPFLAELQDEISGDNLAEPSSHEQGYLALVDGVQ